MVYCTLTDLISSFLGVEVQPFTQSSDVFCLICLCKTMRLETTQENCRFIILGQTENTWRNQWSCGDANCMRVQKMVRDTSIRSSGTPPVCPAP